VNDSEAMALAMQHRDVIAKGIKKFGAQYFCGDEETLNDAQQSCFLELVNIAKHYEPTRGSFRKFAYLSLRRYFIKLHRKNTRLGCVARSESYVDDDESEEEVNGIKCRCVVWSHPANAGKEEIEAACQRFWDILANPVCCTFGDDRTVHIWFRSSDPESDKEAKMHALNRFQRAEFLNFYRKSFPATLTAGELELVSELANIGEIPPSYGSIGKVAGFLGIKVGAAQRKWNRAWAKIKNSSENKKMLSDLGG
jgi:Sigma-70 region 2